MEAEYIALAETAKEVENFNKKFFQSQQQHQQQSLKTTNQQSNFRTTLSIQIDQNILM